MSEMNKAQTITTPEGARMTILPEEDYHALLDALDAAQAKAAADAVARGALETLDPQEIAAFLQASTPLAFWRARRRLTQSALAKRVGISQAYVASLESGARKGDPALFLRLAKALNVPMEALVVDDDAA